MSRKIELLQSFLLGYVALLEVVLFVVASFMARYREGVMKSLVDSGAVL